MKVKVLKRLRAKYAIVRIAPFQYVLFNKKKQRAEQSYPNYSGAYQMALMNTLGHEWTAELIEKNRLKKLTNLSKRMLMIKQLRNR